MERMESATKTPMKSTIPAPAAGEVLYLTEEAAAARYSVSVNFLRRLRYAGKLACLAIGPRLVRYSLASLDAHFAALAQGGEAPRKGAAKGVCNAYRARRNLRPKAKVAVPAGDTVNA